MRNRYGRDDYEHDRWESSEYGTGRQPRSHGGSHGDSHGSRYESSDRQSNRNDIYGYESAGGRNNPGRSGSSYDDERYFSSREPASPARRFDSEFDSFDSGSRSSRESYGGAGRPSPRGGIPRRDRIGGGIGESISMDRNREDSRWNRGSSGTSRQYGSSFGDGGPRSSRDWSAYGRNDQGRDSGGSYSGTSSDRYGSPMDRPVSRGSYDRYEPPGRSRSSNRDSMYSDAEDRGYGYRGIENDMSRNFGSRNQGTGRYDYDSPARSEHSTWEEHDRDFEGGERGFTDRVREGARRIGRNVREFFDRDHEDVRGAGGYASRGDYEGDWDRGGRWR